MAEFPAQLDRIFPAPPGGFGPHPIPCFFRGLDPLHPALPLCLRRESYVPCPVHGTHQHVDFFSLYIVRGGRGIHRVDGVPYAVARGDVYLLEPGSMHAYVDFRDLTLDAIYYPFELVQAPEIEALREMGGFWRLFASAGETGIDRRLHLSPAKHAEVEAEIEKLRAEWSRPGKAAEYLLRSGVFRLLMELARVHGSGPAAEPAQPWNPARLGNTSRALALAEVRRWCESHPAELPTVPRMAAMMCLSPSHFRAVWKRETGVSPSRYLRRLRMERARTQLLSGKYSVAQVAREAGFDDPSHFARAFKAMYEAPPRDYGNQM